MLKKKHTHTHNRGPCAAQYDNQGSWQSTSMWRIPNESKLKFVFTHACCAHLCGSLWVAACWSVRLFVWERLCMWCLLQPYCMDTLELTAGTAEIFGFPAFGSLWKQPNWTAAADTIAKRHLSPWVMVSSWIPTSAEPIYLNLHKSVNDSVFNKASKMVMFHDPNRILLGPMYATVGGTGGTFWYKKKKVLK